MGVCLSHKYRSLKSCDGQNLLTQLTRLHPVLHAMKLCITLWFSGNVQIYSCRL